MACSHIHVLLIVQTKKCIEIAYISSSFFCQLKRDTNPNRCSSLNVLIKDLYPTFLSASVDFVASDLISLHIIHFSHSNFVKLIHPPTSLSLLLDCCVMFPHSIQLCLQALKLYDIPITVLISCCCKKKH